MQFWSPKRANLDLHRCKSGFAGALLDHEVDCVEVGLSLPSSLDVDQRVRLKLLDGAAHGRDMRTHMLGKALLARKAQVVVPSVAQEQGVSRMTSGAAAAKSAR